jgi:signal transduction histidine kinase
MQSNPEDHLAEASSPESLKVRPSLAGLIGVYLALGAITARALAWPGFPQNHLWYGILLLVFAGLYSLELFWAAIPSFLIHLCFVIQTCVILVMFSLNTHLDFLTALFALLSYQAALAFTGRERWIWVVAFIGLTAAPLMIAYGFVRGLGQGLTSMGIAIVLAGFVGVNQEIEAARMKTQKLVVDLQEKHRQLQAYASQVEALAIIEERSHLAHELHDSVSQTLFSIILNTRATQLLMVNDPSRVRPQLEQVQGLIQNALGEMRSLISKLN